MRKKIVVIDNYDSFTYNLVQYVEEGSGHQVTVCRNDAISLEDLESFDLFFLSPGPGLPAESGLLKKIIQKYGPSKKMLGVCLGHQAIAEVYGARLINLDRVYHGVQTYMSMTHKDMFLFRGLNNPFLAGRYHSWVVEPSELPPELEILAFDEERQIMALRHRKFDLYGVQFHPESILTPDGRTIINNFLEFCGIKVIRKQGTSFI